MTVDSYLGWSRFKSYGKPIFKSRFMKFVLKISGIIKGLNPGWGLRHWRPEFDYRWDRTFIFFQSILTLWNLCEKPMRGREKALFSLFLVPLFFFLSSFLSVIFFQEVWTNQFFLLNFGSCKPSVPLFLTIEETQL